ncbi:MAG: succinate dehydrogenase iron-sulfur subunit [Chlamydiia bacterium]|nr:succinate dehydrogenase iron-sulfur subunit [Chlamydiia bacterium]
MPETFILRVLRGKPKSQYWEEFELDFDPGYNVISALMEVQKRPVNRKGEEVAPVVWEQGCLEEVCGSCSMLINGKPGQACTALIRRLLRDTGTNVVTLAPFTKFPLVRDLLVSRDAMFENLKKVSAWIEGDGYFDKGEGPRVSQKKQEVMYAISRCMTCGCCAEGCPQVNKNSDFIGPAAIAQASLFNAHPNGKPLKAKRLHALMDKGGVSACGNAQNCVRVCPKEVPLTDAIAAIGRDATLQAVKDLFSTPDRDD